LLDAQIGIARNEKGSVRRRVRDQNTLQLDGGNNRADMDGNMNTIHQGLLPSPPHSGGQME